MINWYVNPTEKIKKYGCQYLKKKYDVGQIDLYIEEQIDI